ncbi:MAG: hypothetical protein ACR2OL_12495 [Anderseniella sp.]
MKTLKIMLAGAVLALSVPTTMTSTASAYQCRHLPVQVKVHRPGKLAARIQARKSWSVKVKNKQGLAWSVWKIAKNKKIKCTHGGQRWLCKARAKPCQYVVQ